MPGAARRTRAAYLPGMDRITIRAAGLADVELLRAIGRRTFTETFGGANAAADMELYLADQFSPARMRDECRDPDSRFFLAEREGRALGYLKLNCGAAQTEAMGEEAVEIERIYVLAARQRQGIGAMLMEHALAVAREWGANRVWLGVWEKNLAAIAFYGRYGFTRFGEHLFQLGSDAQTDILMRKELQ